MYYIISSEISRWWCLAVVSTSLVQRGCSGWTRPIQVMNLRGKHCSLQTRQPAL